VLQPLINLLDQAESAPNHTPSHEQETTRFPGFPWDLRTVIAVFPPDSPFRFLNLNITLGLTGVPFDQVENWKGTDPKEAFDLQFCLEGNTEETVTYKKYHPATEELLYKPDEVSFELGRRLLFQGRWPAYHIEYRQPEEDLELSIELDSWPGFQWWVCAPRIYGHYTSFCNCTLQWKWKGKEGALAAPALHDHGWGKNMLPLRTPLRIFRYEVMRLPEGDAAISLWTEGPAGTELRNVGLIRWGRDPVHFMRHYECRVLEWEVFENYAGRSTRVPRRWTGTQQGDTGTFAYEAERRSEPRPILGEGFLYGFDYRGKITGTGVGSMDVEGRGYVEQLGFVET